jgi:hypothetical protein
MRREDWIVDERSVRPAGKPDECFYCQAKVGEQHKSECVLRRRTVVVRMTIEHVIDVPEDWDASNIEFHRNESSWCANNAKADLDRVFDRADQDGATCLCGRVHYEYVREATTEDEAVNGVRVDVLTLPVPAPAPTTDP